jgi:hypothetical protein
MVNIASTSARSSAASVEGNAYGFAMPAAMLPRLQRSGE